MTSESERTFDRRRKKEGSDEAVDVDQHLAEKLLSQ